MRPFLAALSLTWVVAVPAADKDALERAISDIQAGRLMEAESALRRLVQQHPASARAWKALGVVYASTGSYILAEPAFREACRIDPGEPDACYYHGRSLYALDRFEASLEVLQRALMRDPQPWRVYLGIAQAQEALGQAEKAEKNFRRAMELGATGRVSPDLHPRLHYGIFLLRQGRTQQAAGELHKVAQELPGLARARYELGRSLLQLGRTEEAATELRKAVELKPGDAAAHRLLSKAYARLGRTEDARRHAELAAQGSRTSR